jgi:hypothetical protein
MKYEENNRFDYFIRLALLDCGGKDAKMFDAIDDSQVVLSARLDRRIKRLISRSERAGSVAKVKHIFVRVAIAVMLIMSLLFATLMSITAVREAIWEAIVEWHENYIVVRYEKSDDTSSDDGQASTDGSAQDNSPQAPAVAPPTKIEEVRKPTYVIEGIIEDIFCSKVKTQVDYYLGDVLLYSFSQHPLGIGPVYIDSDGAIVEKIDIGGTVGTFVTYASKEERILLWNDREYDYVLHTVELDVDALVEIALSVKPYVEEPSDEQPSVTPPTKIEEVRKPTYIIDGAVEDIFQNKTLVYIEYYEEDSFMYSFTQKLLEENDIYIDNEGAKVEEIDINGNAGMMISFFERAEIVIMWHDKEYMYILQTSSISTEELTKVALSVK